MPTAAEIGIDKQAMRDAMLKRINEKEQAQGTRPESGTNGGKKETPTEKRRVKNQAEIDRRNRKNQEIRANNERVDRQRREIGQAVDGALELVSRKLSKNNLSEDERARLSWIKNSVKAARDRADENGRYVVEAKSGERVLDSRKEGVPLEGLVREVKRDIYKAEKVIAQAKQREALKNKADANQADEDSKKREWRAIFDQLPEGNLKKRIEARVKEWEQKDGRQYAGTEMEKQLGEACFEIIKETTAEQLEHGKKITGEKQKEIERYNKILQGLTAGSQDYFSQHFKKFSKALNEADKKKQHPFTIREANLISKDDAYRKILLEDHKSRLPKDFGQMDKEQQDYELAMLALDNRLLLNLPGKKALLPDFKPDYEQEPRPTPGRSAENQGRSKIIILDPVGGGEYGRRTIEGPKKPEKLFLIDISEIAKRMAWTKAEEKLQKEFKNAGLLKRMWKGLSEDAKRIKYYEEALKEIQTDNNLMKAISERVSGQPLPGGQPPRISGEYLELLDKVVAEYKHDVADTQREVGDSMNDNPEVKARFAELLYRFRSDKWDGAEYNGLDKRSKVELFVKKNIAGYINQQKTAQWTKDSGRLNEAKGLLYASNFYEILESVDKDYKQQIDAAVKGVMDRNPDANIEAVRSAISEQVKGVQGLNLQLGLRDRDLVNNRPKGILAKYEKLVNWGENHKVLGKIILNPFVIGAGTALASRGVQRAMKWGAVGAAAALGASGFWVPLGAGALAGGIYRAMKRSKDVKYDIAQELRQETLGGKGSEVLGEKGSSKDLRYEGAIMSFKDALAEVAALKDKTAFSDAEKQQLAKIYARLQLERDLLKSTDKNFTKVDLFNLEEDQGKRYGTTAVAKSDLRVALKKLGVSEKQLQGMIDAEKGAILDIIQGVNKKQEGFRYKEMAKAGAFGAAMGLAGGLAVEGIKEGSHLFSEAYQNYNHDKLAGIAAAFRNTDLYHRWFGASSHIEHFAPVSHGRTAAEYLAGLKGHVSGGNVETIHTQNWYDNPGHFERGADGAMHYIKEESAHVHNLNELRFHISKDSSGDFHFKVPIKEDESWLTRPRLEVAQIEKAFSEDRIKMIFVPDGHSPHEGIVLDVGPNHEIIIPHDGNLKDLFDPTTGRPKGSGFFGLAEQVGSKGDNKFIWINSERGNGNMDFGKITENIGDQVVADRGPVPFDSWTVPTVPPTRKVWLRPEERAAKEAAEKKKEEEKAKKKAEKKHKKGGHGHGDHSTGSHEGGGGAHKEKEKEKEEGKTKEPEFKGDTLKRYLNPKFTAALLNVYKRRSGDLPKIEENTINYALEPEKHKDDLEAPLQKEVAKAVWEMEQALVNKKIISQERADEVYEGMKEKATPPKEQAAPKGKDGEAGKEKPQAGRRSREEKNTETEGGGGGERRERPQRESEGGEEFERMNPDVQAVVNKILEKYPLVRDIKFIKPKEGRGLSGRGQKERVDGILKDLKGLDLEGKKGKSFSLVFSPDSTSQTKYKESQIILPFEYGVETVGKVLEKAFKKSEKAENGAKAGRRSGRRDDRRGRDNRPKRQAA